jgi:hypothetical protein
MPVLPIIRFHLPPLHVLHHAQTFVATLELIRMIGWAAGSLGVTGYLVSPEDNPMTLDRYHLGCQARQLESIILQLGS